MAYLSFFFFCNYEVKIGILFHFKIINYFLTEKLLVRLEPLSMIKAVRAATLGDGNYTITAAIKSSKKCFEKKKCERRKRKIN